MTATKICKTCKTPKPLEAFSKAKENRDRLKHECRECYSARYKVWYDKNQEKMCVRASQYAKTESARARRKERYHTDEEYRLRRREQCRRSKQTEGSRQNVLEWQRTQRANNPHYKLRSNLNRRIRNVLMGKSKSAATMILVGGTTETVRAHIEKQWLPGMSWTNYGIFGWHIDHIIPCAAFDLSRPEEQARCFHYTNLQPLWAMDNWRKQDWVPDYQI